MKGLTVGKAAQLLRAAGCERFCIGMGSLPEPLEFDDCHARWRQQLIGCAEASGLAGFSHGRAAKLINVFLKSLYLSDFRCLQDQLGQTPSKIDAMHPPIDRVLLSELKRHGPPGLKAAIRTCGNTNWTTMDSESYQHLIDAIKAETAGRLWMIESYWQGHQ
ncbi:hypothetical protein [Cribrihabitans pelagius]|uniref:hypothetical protein n=1 Tax=Cribrihabitans pelagius TaxID=1765746 RepID=UPI003B59D5EE